MPILPIEAAVFAKKLYPPPHEKRLKKDNSVIRIIK